MNILDNKSIDIFTGSDILSTYGENNRSCYERIKSVLIHKGYINCGLVDAMILLIDYSDTYTASWLGLPGTDVELFEILKKIYCYKIIEYL